MTLIPTVSLGNVSCDANFILFQKKKKILYIKYSPINKKKFFLKFWAILRHTLHNPAMTGNLASLKVTFCYTEATFATLIKNYRL